MSVQRDADGRMTSREMIIRRYIVLISRWVAFSSMSILNRRPEAR
jgi:hypothetical protein